MAVVCWSACCEGRLRQLCAGAMPDTPATCYHRTMVCRLGGDGLFGLSPTNFGAWTTGLCTC